MDKKYTIAETAKLLRVSGKTVLREIGRGKLNPTKAGRKYLISQKDVDNYLTPKGSGQSILISDYLSSKKSDVVALLQKLVSMSSVSDEGESERQLALFLNKYFRKKGIRSVLYEDSGTVCVRATYGFAEKGILLDAPLDTTPPGDLNKWTYPPFDGVVKNGSMYGRGTADCKAGMVAMIYTLLALKKYIPEEDVRVEVVFDGGEQTGEYKGMKLALAKGLPVVAGIVGYAGDWQELMIGARGYHRYKFTVHGKSAHTGARYNTGINAISKTVKLVCALEKIDFPESKNKLFKFGNRLTFAQIEGGKAINIVPDTCSTSLDVRIVPEISRQLVDEKIYEVTEKLKKEDKDLNVKVHYLTGQEGYVLDPNEKIVKIAQMVLTEHLKKPVPLVATGPAHIGNLLALHNIPVILWGPKGGNVHGYDEYVEIDSISKTAEMYSKVILEYFLSER